jgi:hypothetical protein
VGEGRPGCRQEALPEGQGALLLRPDALDVKGLLLISLLLLSERSAFQQRVMQIFLSSGCALPQ